jgi:MFS family permease
LANHGAREPGYAWVVVAVLFLANAVASGTQGSFGLLVRPWETEFGWERAAISLTASIGFVVYGTAQALSGRWADRIGPRTIFVSGLVILGVGTAGIGSILTLWQAYLVFGVLMSIGFGASSSSTSAVAIARWFSYAGGVIHDLTGSYSAFFAAAALLAAAATGIAWAISETRIIGSLQTPAT